MLFIRNSFTCKYAYRLKVKGYINVLVQNDYCKKKKVKRQRKIYYANTNQKEVEVATVITEESKEVIRAKKEHYLIIDS